MESEVEEDEDDDKDESQKSGEGPAESDENPSDRDNTRGPPAKRIRTAHPRTTQTLIEDLQDQAPLILRSQTFHPRSIAQEVLEQLSRDPTLHQLREEIRASLSLLGHIFGDKGCNNFRNLYREHHQALRRGGLTAAKLSTTVANELDELGCPTFSRLLGIWGALRRDEASSRRCIDVRQLHAYLELVRVWESTNIKNCTQADELEILRNSPKFQDFLDRRKLRRKQGVTHQSQLTSFIADQLQISKRSFALTVHRYKPLAILARYFGDGILAFLPRSKLLSRFRQLHVKSEDDGGGQKGDLAFCTVIEKVISLMPGITELCALSEQSLVRPIIEGGDLPPTLGTSYLDSGEKDAFQTHDVWGLVEAGGLGVARRVEELTNASAEKSGSGRAADDQDGSSEDGSERTTSQATPRWASSSDSE